MVEKLLWSYGYGICQAAEMSWIIDSVTIHQ